VPRVPVDDSFVDRQIACLVALVLVHFVIELADAIESTCRFNIMNLMVFFAEVGVYAKDEHDSTFVARNGNSSKPTRHLKVLSNRKLGFEVNFAGLEVDNTEAGLSLNCDLFIVDWD